MVRGRELTARSRRTSVALAAELVSVSAVVTLTPIAFVLQAQVKHSPERWNWLYAFVPLVFLVVLGVAVTFFVMRMRAERSRRGEIGPQAGTGQGGGQDESRDERRAS